MFCWMKWSAVAYFICTGVTHRITSLCGSSCSCQTLKVQFCVQTEGGARHRRATDNTEQSHPQSDNHMNMQISWEFNPAFY